MAKNVTVKMIGKDALTALYSGLRVSVANQIARPAVMSAASVAAKKVKAAIPSRYKSVRKAIGARALKVKYNSGIAGAKVGAGVGKQTEAKKKKAEAAYEARKKNSDKGVGISANNVHWWFLGTGDRKLKRGSERGPKAGHPTGRMKPQEQPITTIVQRYAAQMQEVMRRRIEERMPVVLAKLKAKGKSAK